MEKIFFVTDQQETPHLPETFNDIEILRPGPGMLHPLKAFASEEGNRLIIVADTKNITVTQLTDIIANTNSPLVIPHQEFSEAESSSLVSWLESRNNVPGAIVVCSELIQVIESASSYAELVLKLSVAAVTHGLNQTTTPTIDSVILSSPKDRALALRMAIDLVNIEELYPNLHWKTSDKEAAAQGYQNLAAAFVRLRDFQSARDCLNCSDQFEESPRALALKAIIARENGETLGAVANMVSSLQQYELRKNEGTLTNTLSSTRSIEVINSHLVAGLEALNRKDNEEALDQFSEAVYAFDPFYENVGLKSRRS